MKVVELINRLKQLPENSDIIIQEEAKSGLALEIIDVTKAKIKKFRGSNNQPMIKCSTDIKSEEAVIIEITDDF